MERESWHYEYISLALFIGAFGLACSCRLVNKEKLFQILQRVSLQVTQNRWGSGI